MHGGFSHMGSNGPFLDKMREDGPSGGSGGGPSEAQDAYSKLPPGITDKLTQLGVEVSKVDLDKVAQALQGIDQNIANFRDLRDKFFLDKVVENTSTPALVTKLSKEICQIIDQTEGLTDVHKTKLKEELASTIDQIANNLLLGKIKPEKAEGILKTELAAVIAAGQIENIPVACNAIISKITAIQAEFQTVCDQHSLQERIYIPKGLTRDEILVALVLNSHLDQSAQSEENPIGGHSLQVLETLLKEKEINADKDKKAKESLTSIFSGRYAHDASLQTITSKDFATVVRVLDEVESGFKDAARAERKSKKTQATVSAGSANETTASAESANSQAASPTPQQPSESPAKAGKPPVVKPAPPILALLDKSDVSSRIYIKESYTVAQLETLKAKVIEMTQGSGQLTGTATNYTPKRGRSVEIGYEIQQLLLKEIDIQIALKSDHSSKSWYSYRPQAFKAKLERFLGQPSLRAALEGDSGLSIVRQFVSEVASTLEVTRKELRVEHRKFKRAQRQQQDPLDRLSNYVENKLGEIKDPVLKESVTAICRTSVLNVDQTRVFYKAVFRQLIEEKLTGKHTGKNAVSAEDLKTVRALKNYVCTRIVQVARARAKDSSKSIAIIPRNPDQPPAHPALVKAAQRLTDQAQHAFKAITGLEDSKKWNMQLGAACKLAYEGRYTAGQFVQRSDPRKLPRELNRDPQVVGLFKELAIKIDRELKRINDGAVKNTASYRAWKAAQVASLDAVVDWGGGLGSGDVLNASGIKTTIKLSLLRAHPSDIRSIDEAIAGLKQQAGNTSKALVDDLTRISKEIKKRPWEFVVSPNYREPGGSPNSTDRRSSAAHAELEGLRNSPASVHDPRLDPTLGLLFPVSEARYLAELRLSILPSALYAQLEQKNRRYDDDLIHTFEAQINKVTENPELGLRPGYAKQLRKDLDTAFKRNNTPQNRDIKILTDLFAARLTDLAFQRGVNHECDKLRDGIAQVLQVSRDSNDFTYNQISALIATHLQSPASHAYVEDAQQALIRDLPTSLNRDQKLNIQNLIEQSGRTIRGVELVDSLDSVLARLSDDKHKEVVQVVYDLMPIDATGLSDDEVQMLYQDRNKVIELFARQVFEVDSPHGKPTTSEELAFKVFDIIERRWPENLTTDLGWIARLVTYDPNQIDGYKAIQGLIPELLKVEHTGFDRKTDRLTSKQSKILEKAVEDYIDAVVILRADLDTSHQAFVDELNNKLGAKSIQPVSNILLASIEAKSNQLKTELAKLIVHPKVKDQFEGLKKAANKEQKLLLDTAYKALEIPTLKITEEQIVKATKVRNQVLDLLLKQAKAVEASNSGDSAGSQVVAGEQFRDELKKLLDRTLLSKATPEMQLLATLVTYDPEAVTHYQAVKGAIDHVDAITIANPGAAPSKLPEKLVAELQKEMWKLAADYTARKISSDEVALALSAKLSHEIAQLVTSNTAINAQQLNNQLTTACNNFKTALSECVIVPGVDKYQELIDSQKTAPYLQNLLTSVRDSMPIEVKGLSDAEYLKKLEARNSALDLMLTQANAVSEDRAKPGTPSAAKNHTAMIAEVEKLVNDAGYAQAAAPLIKRDLNLIAAIITKDPAVAAQLFNKFKGTEAKIRKCLTDAQVNNSSIVQFNTALEKGFEALVTHQSVTTLTSTLEAEVAALPVAVRPEINELVKDLSNNLATSGYGPVSELDKSNNIMQATLQEINRQHQGRGIVIELELTGRLNGENGILIKDTVTGSRVKLRFNHDSVLQAFNTPAAQKEQALIALYSKITNALNYMRAESEIEVPGDKGAPSTKHKVQVIPDLATALNVLGLNSEGDSTGADGLIDINNSSIILGPTSIQVGEPGFADKPLATLLESFIPANIRQAGMAKTALIKGEGEAPVDPVGDISLISFKDKYRTQAVLDRFFQRQPVVITFDQGQSYSPANGGFRSSRGPNEVHSVHVNVDKNLAGIVEVLGVVSSSQQGRALEQWRRRYILPEDPKLTFKDRQQLIKEIVAQVATNKSTQDFDDYAEGQNLITKLANRADDTLTNSVIGGMEIINPDVRDGRASISGQDISRGRLEVSAERRQNGDKTPVKILASNTKAHKATFAVNNSCIIGNNFDAEGASFTLPVGQTSSSVELVLGQGSSLKNVSVQEGIKVSGDVRNVDMTGYQPEELKKLLKLEDRFNSLTEALKNNKGTKTARLATVGADSTGRPGFFNKLASGISKPVRFTAKQLSSSSDQPIDVDGELRTKGQIVHDLLELEGDIKKARQAVTALARNLVWNGNTRDDNQGGGLNEGLIGYIRRNKLEKEAPRYSLRYDSTLPSDFIKDVAHNAAHSSAAMTAGQELLVNQQRGDVTLRADDERKRVKFELATNHPLLTDNPEVAEEIKETGVKVEDATILLQALHDYDNFVELCRLINEEKLRKLIRKDSGDTQKQQMDMAEMLKRRGIDPSRLPQS